MAKIKTQTFFPALGDVFERSKAFEGLQALAVVVGVDEGGEVFAQPVMTFVVVSPGVGRQDGRREADAAGIVCRRGAVAHTRLAHATGPIPVITSRSGK